MMRRRNTRTVSVALATYNGAEFISEQLASLACQTYLPLELVVSDDGSTDNTLDLIETFATTAPFEVKILSPHPRLGFSDNFLHAAENCRGDYIAFCDQDDWWSPCKIETQINRLVQDDSCLALHRLSIADAVLNDIGKIWAQGIECDAVFEPRELNPYCTGWGNSMVFDRSLLYLIGRDQRPRQPEADRPLSHDTWIYVLAAGMGRVSHVFEPLLLYRQHTASVCGFQYGRVPFLMKIKIAFTVHEARLRAEQEFHESMAAIFSRISEGHAAARDVALAASDCYRERSRLCDLRLRTYNEKRISLRLNAFRKCRTYTAYRPTRNSSFKEAVFGVLGIKRLGDFVRFGSRETPADSR